VSVFGLTCMTGDVSCARAMLYWLRSSRRYPADEPQRLVASNSRHDAQRVMAVADPCRADRDHPDGMLDRRRAIRGRVGWRHATSASIPGQECGSALPILSGSRRPHARSGHVTAHCLPAAVVRPQFNFFRNARLGLLCSSFLASARSSCLPDLI